MKRGLVLFVAIFLLFSCENRHSDIAEDDNGIAALQKPDLREVNFFIENSGSMKGYINAGNEFSKDVFTLIYHKNFDDVEKKRFYFINANSNSIINCEPFSIEKDLEDSDNYNRRHSDLTGYFKTVLDSVKENSISVLVSDGLFDVGDSRSPIISLRKEIDKTAEHFRKKLRKEDLRVVVLKSVADFDGYYYPSSKPGQVLLSDAKRPFYIWIFGNGDLIDKYLPRKDLSGFENYSRFIKLTNNNSFTPKYEASSIDLIGKFKASHRNKKVLEDVAKPRRGDKFQFSIAVDYSKLPFTNENLEDTSNYEITNGFRLKNIKSENIPDFAAAGFKPTHLITVSTMLNPNGKLNIYFKNDFPDWITYTGAKNENNMQSDSTHTFGFTELSMSIAKAYNDVSTRKHAFSISFQLEKEKKTGLYWFIIIALAVLGLLVFIIQKNN